MPATNDDILTKIGDFHAEFTEFRGEMKARVSHIEKEQSDAKFWENVKMIAVLPLVGGLHALGIKIGWFKG